MRVDEAGIELGGAPEARDRVRMPPLASQREAEQRVRCGAVHALLERLAHRTLGALRIARAQQGRGPSQIGARHRVRDGRTRYRARSPLPPGAGTPNSLRQISASVATPPWISS